MLSPSALPNPIFSSLLPLLDINMVNNSALEEPTGEYRRYLPDLNVNRFQTMCTQDAHEYAHDFKTLKQPPWLHALYMHWLELLQEPFKGVTTDGESISIPALRRQPNHPQVASGRTCSHYKMKSYRSSKSWTQRIPYLPCWTTSRRRP